MLYLANSPSIFPQVSTHELMRLSRGTMGSPPAPGFSPSALQRGTPPGGPPAPGPRAEPGAKKPLSKMTSEEIQAERRKRKAKEAANKTAEQGGPV
jgi:hypothetical protein